MKKPGAERKRDGTAFPPGLIEYTRRPSDPKWTLFTALLCVNFHHSFEEACVVVDLSHFNM